MQRKGNLRVPFFMCSRFFVPKCVERKNKKGRCFHNDLLYLVPRRGLEPPRSYPLVPETSASTNSATWAFRVSELYSAKWAALAELAKFFVEGSKRGANEKAAAFACNGLSCLVPRRGLEPPRSYPLVPETSASTNSATWAFREVFKHFCLNFKFSKDANQLETFQLSECFPSLSKPSQVVVKLGAQERTRTSTELPAST